MRVLDGYSPEVLPRRATYRGVTFSVALVARGAGWGEARVVFPLGVRRDCRRSLQGSPARGRRGCLVLTGGSMKHGGADTPIGGNGGDFLPRSADNHPAPLPAPPRPPHPR